METLENFIAKYLKNKQKTDYNGWLALYGEDSQAAYQGAKKEADTGYAKALAEHGARAASLYRAGLAGSGYSDYLNHSAYAQKSDALALAKKQKQSTDARNQKGYLAFLKELSDKEEKEAADQKTREDKLFESLLAKNITDEQAAVSYLITVGMDPVKAQELATKSIAIQTGKQSFHTRLITLATSAGMSYSNAYKYALTQGVTEDVARMIASAVDIAVKEKKYDFHY